MINVIDGSFQADAETLSYSYYLPDQVTGSALSLHGAGPAGRDRIAYLAEFLAHRGKDVFCFDFSGHGGSTGSLRESSLARRRKQAISALAMTKSNPHTLIGTSMGGHVALSILNKVNILYLILFCPALYSDDAQDAPFDERFSKAIRVSNGYEKSSLRATMRNYSGKSILFIGDNDPIIPPKVVDIYASELSNKGSFELIKLPNAPHMIHRWVLQNPDNMSSVISPIVSFFDT